MKNALLILLKIITISTISFSVTNSQPVINEFMASNLQTISDEAGEYDDWIEIYNRSEKSFNLSGYFLTDNFNNPTRWRVPNFSIPAKGFLLIWADSDTSQGDLHANFKLDADGEQIGLFDGSNFIDSLTFPQQKRDISYGRYADGGDEWYFFLYPSPGSPNALENIRFAQTPQFSPPGGFFVDSVRVEIQVSASPSQIFYSLDCSEPDQLSFLYTKSILIDKTTVIRARAYQANARPSNIVTFTYFVDKKFDIPTISLVTNPSNLWDPDSGLYMNPSERGDEWERPVSVEFYQANGSLCFLQNAGIRMHGETAQLYDKKPFRLYFRAEYGQNWLEYPLFPIKSGVTAFKRLVVHSGGTDMPINPYSYGWTLIRDPLMQELTRRINGLYLTNRPVALYLNGEPWGIYNLGERLDKYFIGVNLGEWDVDLIENSNIVKEGDIEAWQQMTSFFTNNDFSSDSTYDIARTFIDIKSLTDYFIIQIYSGNGDWLNNVFSFRPRNNGATWRWIVQDMDGSFGPYGLYHNTLESATREDEEDALYLRKLLENQNYRIFFINRFADLLNTTFNVTTVLPLIDSLASAIESDISFETDRWGSSPTEWLQNGVYGEMADFAQKRSRVVYDQLQTKFDFEGMVNLTVEQPVDGKGIIRVNTIYIVTYPWSGIYFQNIPIEIEAIAVPGYQFKEWIDKTLPQSAKINLNLTEDLQLQSVFEPETGIEKNLKVTNLPSCCVLSQNYPNPFNEVTQLKYQLSQASWVRITIYNVVGSLIKILVNQRQAAGTYLMVWDGRDDNCTPLPSGLYIIQMTTDDLVLRRKIILMR